MTTRAHARARRHAIASRLAHEVEQQRARIAWDAIVTAELMCGTLECTQCGARLQTEAAVARLEVFERDDQGLPTKVRVLCVACAADERY